MRSLVLLALASCVVVHVEPVRVERVVAPGSATTDAGIPPGMNCTTLAVPGAPTICIDSRDNDAGAPASISPTGIPSQCSSLSITSAAGAACLQTVSPEFLGGEDNMPGVGYVPLGDAGSAAPP